MNRVAIGLLLLGLLQMTGDLLGIAALKGVGAASGASPAPKVFTAAGGYETFSTRFFIEWSGVDGEEHSVELTPELYAGIAGPYNRRNVFGAVVAYGPVLASDRRGVALQRSVSRYALCGDAPLLEELGIDPSRVRGSVRVRYEPVPGKIPEGLPLVLESRCP